MSQNNTPNWKPKWQKDLDTYYSIYNTFIFTGYVDDMLPLEQNGEVTYVNMEKYIETQYGGESPKKCVIVYDPTESEDKQFRICAKQLDMPPVDDEEEDADVPEVGYEDTRAQHFYDITKSDDIRDWLIDHKSSGPTLALSYIHYALTENSERISETEKVRLPERIRSLFNVLFGGGNSGEYVFVIKMASRLLTRDTVSGNGNGISDDELIIFRQLLNIAQSIQNSDAGKIILLANKKEDLPVWFTDEISNHYLKIIDIEKPSEENRRHFFESELIYGGALSDGFVDAYNNSDDDYKKKVQKKYAAYTDDFTMGMHVKFGEYVKVMKQNGESPEFDDPEKIGFIVTTFRAGQMVNPWNDPTKVRALINIKEDVEKDGIMGQEQALTQAQKILTSAAVGLGRSGNDSPRAVLFLAGPTGTGKTELCKQIAEKVFGSKEKMVRFDMSEYREAESDQKLFGAPPGYVGYEAGGRLTNAIKKEPFSLVLFDEIEKAHPTILDKFLQIVGDGRLTDGKGETVRFTDCIIVVTSNAGIKPDKEITPHLLSTQMGEERKNFTPEFAEFADPESPNGTTRAYNDRVITIADIIAKEKAGVNGDIIYANLKEQLRYYVKAYFYCKLGRPELYGRFSNSMVYYNFIASESVRPIARKRIKAINKDAMSVKGLADIDYSAVEDKIVSQCNTERVRASGARGILNEVSDVYGSSLNDFFARELKNGSTQSYNGRTLICELAPNGESKKEIDSCDLQWRLA